MSNETLGFAESSEAMMDLLARPFELAEWLITFLSTHPLAIGTRNSVSVALGEGGTIGFAQPGRAVEEFMGDLIGDN